jgi:hypothetical protein
MDAAVAYTGGGDDAVAQVRACRWMIDRFSLDPRLAERVRAALSGSTAETLHTGLSGGAADLKPDHAG